MTAAFHRRAARLWTACAGYGGVIELARRSTHPFAHLALFRAKFSFAPLQIRPQHLYAIRTNKKSSTVPVAVASDD